MPRDGRIIDIRYYADDNADSGVSPERSFPAAEWVGDRLCRKLRELGLRLGKLDHVYFYVGAGTVRDVRTEPSNDFFRRVHCVLDPTSVVGLTAAQREDLLADLTCEGLRLVCEPGQAELIDRARAELAQHRRAMSVGYFEKDTRSTRCAYRIG